MDRPFFLRLLFYVNESRTNANEKADTIDKKLHYAFSFNYVQNYINSERLLNFLKGYATIHMLKIELLMVT